ncbi:MAG: putative iron-regulated protein [Flavobacteriales bacterium]|jgi:putative iron-regulated protein
MKSIKVFCLAGSCLFMSACGGGNTDTVQVETVKNNYTDMAYAAYGDSLTQAQALLNRVDELIAEPSEERLTAAKSAYKDARIPYQQSEIMRWDTAITLDANLDLDGGPASVDEWEGQVNAWPLDENHIDALIESDVDINKTLLIAQNGAADNEANVSTGVHAVEFLLWGRDNNGTEPGAGEQLASAFSQDDCPDDLCLRRAEYLRAATELLVDDLELMLAEWSPSARSTEGTLAYNFLNNDQALEYILGSIRAMASDELASARMSSGLELGDPEEEHDCFSDLSHVAIYYNFQGVRNAFYGRYGEVDGASVADLILQKNPETYFEINAKLNDIETLMAKIFVAGERNENTVRYDQIIGQASDGVERIIAESAVDQLIDIDSLFVEAQEILALSEIIIVGGGD